MDARQFEKEVLQVIRCVFPDLYAEHIEGRKRVFLSEHYPLTTLASLAGEVVGKVPPPARMVWAVRDLLQGQRSKRWNWKHLPKTHSELCSGVKDCADDMMLSTLDLGFWEVCSNALNPKAPGELWILTSSWDVVLVKYPEQIPKEEILCKLQKISVTFTGAAIAKGCAERLKRT